MCFFSSLGNHILEGRKSYLLGSYIFGLSIKTGKIHKAYESTVSVGANVMLMNGLPVDVTSLELYELMDRVSALPSNE